MVEFLKNTQTLINSSISTMLVCIIDLIKPKGQDIKLSQSSKFRILKLLTLNLVFLIYMLFTSKTYAIVDPLTSPNNKFGIHIISASVDESKPAKNLVNSSGGDWGYITVLITSKDRDHNKWQNFFDDIRRKHLIPIVRVATELEGSYWKRPYDGEEEAWADFLDKLNWPIKNKYVVIYNEPNHAQEWGNLVDAKDYAKTLDQTITALKTKNSDFFVLNAGFDASAPQKIPLYQDQLSFMHQMNEEVPGIFNKLDGWVSHSYPNPGFAGLPSDIGRGSIRTYLWEVQVLRSLGVRRDLPIFITETGWKHAEGIDFDKSLPISEKVGEYFKQAFSSAWNSNRVVAVTPFLLNYQEPPFDHFSFKKLTGEKQNIKILGIQYPEYYPQYETIGTIPKKQGQPYQIDKAELIEGQIFSTLVSGETYDIPLVFKNTGQSIWGERDPVKLEAVADPNRFAIEPVILENGQKIEPNQQASFNLQIKAPKTGKFTIKLQLFNGDKQFDQPLVEFPTEIKSPVILMVKTTLKWKKDHAGDYLLSIFGPNKNLISRVQINPQGESESIEVRLLLPDHNFKFSLSKPYYKEKTISAKVQSGINVLDFGQLQPDLWAGILSPKELFKLFGIW